MTASSYRESATIYQFPKGGRAAMGGPRDGSKVAENFLAVPRIAKVASGSAWYHEEAVQDADRGRKI